MLESLFNRVAGLKACNFIKKETPAQVFSCEYGEISKNSFFDRTLAVAASGFELCKCNSKSQLHKYARSSF